MFESITGTDITIGAMALSLLGMLGKTIISNWFETKRDGARDSAEASLYDNLSKENSRMAETMRAMSEQLNSLITDNSKLLTRVAELERSIQKLSIWETKAMELQVIIGEKDIIINDQKKQLLEQALLIDKMERRTT